SSFSPDGGRHPVPRFGRFWVLVFSWSFASSCLSDRLCFSNGCLRTDNGKVGCGRLPRSVSRVRSCTLSFMLVCWWPYLRDGRRQMPCDVGRNIGTGFTGF